MAKNETRQLRPAVLAEDREVYTALKAITNYAPANPDFSHAALDDSFAVMEAAQAEEIRAKAVWEAARDNKVAAEWAFHNKTLGAKDQTKAQFGPNSNQLQSLKLKKKIEYNSPPPRSKKGDGTNQ
ncbi:MAG TPA: hypothetical protein VF658_14660 [Pyrinomonadaceae bacterium]|jgi:hypothetical protein